MEIQEFTEKVTKALYQYYDAKVKIETHKVYKNNGILLQGICALHEGRNIAPTVYLNDFLNRYRQGENFGKLIKEIIRLIEHHQPSQNLDVEFFTDYEKVRKKLVFRLIHRERNEKMLKNIPFEEVQDLAIVCQCLMMTEEIGTGTILITKEHLKHWKVSQEQLFQDTLENSFKIQPHCILKMSDMVRSILADTVKEQVEEICEQYPQDQEALWERTMENMVQEVEEQGIPMYVLTNAGRYYGAACMIYPGVLKEIAGLLQDDLYILPSSVHEIILINKSQASDASFLNEMIREVNKSQVEEEEWLSDHAYLYQRSTDQLISVMDQGN